MGSHGDMRASMTRDGDVVRIQGLDRGSGTMRIKRMLIDCSVGDSLRIEICDR
jgi:hypothetical protein